MKKAYLVFFAAIMAVACQKADPATEQAADEKLPIRFSFGLETKATDAGFENGDKVGIYVSYDGTLASFSNYVDNNEYTLEGGRWTTANEIYWNDKVTPADFYCYHPYAPVGDALAHSFSVKADQSAIENYKASDFVWGSVGQVAPLSKVVAISTKHILSNLLIYLKAGEGFTSSEFASATKSIQLGNLRLNSLINLSDGTVQATGDKGSLIPYWNGECYRAVVVPQTIDTSNNLVTLTINGVSYSMAKQMIFSPRTQHKLTITVNKTTSGLNLSIEQWEIDSTEHSGEAM